MLHYFFTGLLRLFFINSFCKAAAHKTLRGGVLGNSPSVWLAELILHVNKIADNDITLTLQPRYNCIKALVAALFVVTELFKTL